MIDWESESPDLMKAQTQQPKSNIQGRYIYYLLLFSDLQWTTKFSLFQYAKAATSWNTVDYESTQNSSPQKV